MRQNQRSVKKNISRKSKNEQNDIRCISHSQMSQPVFLKIVRYAFGALDLLILEQIYEFFRVQYCIQARVARSF